MKLIYTRTQHLLMFLIYFLGYQSLLAQNTTVTIDPIDVKHQVNSHVIGSNRNHSQAAEESTLNLQPGTMDAIEALYGSIQHMSGGRKLYRTGHTPTDGESDYANYNCAPLLSETRQEEWLTRDENGNVLTDDDGNPIYAANVYGQEYWPLTGGGWIDIPGTIADLDGVDYSDFQTEGYIPSHLLRPEFAHLENELLKPLSSAYPNNGGYHFADYIPEESPEGYDKGEIYHTYDWLGYAFEEAKSMNMDLIVSVNFGTGSAEEAAAMVHYIKSKTYDDGERWLDRVAFFELGNEITGNWVSGHPCTNNPLDYAVKARTFIDAIDQIDSSVKIGVCASHGYGFKWQSSGEDLTHMVEAYTKPDDSNFKGLVKNGSPIYDFIAFHGYNDWPGPLLNIGVKAQVGQPCVGPGAETCEYTTETSYANPRDWYVDQNGSATDFNEVVKQLLGVAIHGAEVNIEGENGIRDLMETALGSNHGVKMANTEFSSYFQDSFEEQWPIFHSTVEAMYTAENIRIALEYDYESAISFTFLHFGNPSGDPEYISDNLNFKYREAYPDAADQSTYSAKKEAFIMPNFCVQEMIAGELGTNVVATEVLSSDIDKIDDDFAQAPGTSHAYSKIGAVSTVDPSTGQIKTLLINRSNQDVVIDLSVANGDVWSGEIRSQGGNSWTSKEVKFNNDGNANSYYYDQQYSPITNLSSLTLKARSINIAKLSPTSVPPVIDPVCLTLPCNVATVEICGTTLRVTPTASGIQSINVIDPNNGWGLVESLCNSWTPPFCTGTMESTILNANQSYQVNITMSNGTVGCEVPFTTSSVPTGCSPPVGTPCDDLNPATQNDVIGAGCVCAGTPLIIECQDISCADAFTATECDGTLSFTYVNSSLSYINVLSLPSYTPTSLCDWQNSCSNGASTITLPVGDYQIDASGPSIFCSKEFAVEGTVVVIADTDGDGVPNNEDCAPTNPFLPTTIGSPCNDFNSNTTNDVIQSDRCTCQGSENPVCAPKAQCNGFADIEICEDEINVYILSSFVSRVDIQNGDWSPHATPCSPWGEPCTGVITIPITPGNSYRAKVFVGNVASCDIPLGGLAKNGNNLENAQDQIVITPNPTNGQFSLVGVNNFDFETTLDVYDISGRKVLTETIGTGNVPSTDVSHLMEGIYIATLTKPDGELVYRGKISHLK